MKVRMLCAGLLLSSFAVANSGEPLPKSITVLNHSPEAVDLWVNGEYRKLRAGTAMLQPCLTGENVEIQVRTELTNISCGESKEIAE